jgi:ribosomal protein L40E
MAKKTIGYVELEWTCPNCGGINPGTEQSCASCGAPQPEDVEFEQARRQELIEEEGIKAKVAAGADIHCPYCGTRNPANAEVCAKCGGDISEGLQRKSGRVVGAYKTGPVTQVNCPHCGAENPDTAKSCTQCGGSMRVDEGEKAPSAVPTRQDKPSKKSNPLVMVVIIGMLVIVCGIAALLIILSMRTEAVTGTVQKVQWERSVVIEALVPVEYQDWLDEIPAEAEIEYCEEELHHIQNEPTGNSVEVCGTPYTVDTGSGIGEVVQDCEYQVYADYCTYSLIEWSQVDEVILTGSDHSPIWPDPNLSENQRLGSDRSETYTIIFDTGEGIYTFKTGDLDLFQSGQIGSEWNLNINTFGSVVSIEP